MARLKDILVLLLCSAGILLAWTPLRLEIGGRTMILGGYVWMRNLKSGILLPAPSVVFTGIFAALTYIHFKISGKNFA